jgi:hypothetical protein
VYTVPGDPSYAPLSITKDRHYYTTFLQYYTWDPAKGAPVASGDITPIVSGLKVKKNTKK